MKNTVRSLALGVASLSLVACGGDESGGSTGGGGTGNRAPSFTTSASLSTNEQRLDESQPTQPSIIAQLAASDADNDQVTFTILADKDGDLFEFQGGVNGALAFVSPPSFETPEDLNGDNVYEVDISASDGKASVTRTFKVSVVNTTEGLTLTRLATGLPANAHVVYDPFNEILTVISRQGRVFTVNTTSGALTDRGIIPSLPADTDILDVVPTEIGASGFAMVLRKDKTISMLVVRRNDIGQVVGEWAGQTFTNATQPITASLWVGGSEPYLALGDGGIPEAAQDPYNFLGNLIGFDFFVAPAGQPLQLTPDVGGWGLRSPRLVDAYNLNISIDRGESFNELTSSGFSSGRNFEWPIRDGFAELGFAGTVMGRVIAPLFAVEIGVNDVGAWTDGLSGLTPFGWGGVVILPDENGNIFTYSFVSGRDPLFEKRNEDFTPNAGSIDKIVSVASNSASAGNRFWLLDSDGELFEGRITQ